MNEPDQRRLAQCLEDGLSCREAAKRIGVSAPTAIRWAKRLGLTSRRSRRISPEIRAALLSALGAGASPAQVAAQFGIHPRTATLMQDPEMIARRREASRERLIAALRGGAALHEAAALAEISLSTAGRWAREAGLPPARARRRSRRDDEAKALAAMEAGMSGREAAATFDLSEAAVARLAKRSRLAPERLARRQRLFAALATGISCRKAAAQVGLPVATAIRWARQRGEVVVGERTGE
jgi:transposase